MLGFALDTAPLANRLATTFIPSTLFIMLSKYYLDDLMNEPAPLRLSFTLLGSCYLMRDLEDSKIQLDCRLCRFCGKIVAYEFRQLVPGFRQLRRLLCAPVFQCLQGFHIPHHRTQLSVCVDYRSKRVGPFRICSTVYAWVHNDSVLIINRLAASIFFSILFIVLSVRIIPY